jgi:hypothetical protein
MKIALLGNCQVEVYSALLAASGHLDLESVQAFEIWRFKPDAFLGIAKEIARCDLVVTQTLGDNYGPLATSVLSRGPIRLVRILNIHFTGYVPDCTYIGPMGARKKSIVGDYHSRHVHDCYSAGLSLDQCIRGLRNYDIGIVAESFREGTAELHRREADVDVPASDLVLDPNFGPSHFFTFNHPKVELHRRYLERVLMFAGITGPVNTSARDPLKVHTQWPIYPAVYAFLGRAVSETVDESRFVASRTIGGRTYGLEEFCEKSYAHYGQNY